MTQELSPSPGTVLPQGDGAAHVTQNSDVEPVGELGSRELASGVTRDRQEETPGGAAGADVYVVVYRAKGLEWHSSVHDDRESAERTVDIVEEGQPPSFAFAYRVERLRVVDPGEWKPFVGTGEPHKES
jgi:hypothetical protein